MRATRLIIIISAFVWNSVRLKLHSFELLYGFVADFSYNLLYDKTDKSATDPQQIEPMEFEPKIFSQFRVLLLTSATFARHLDLLHFLSGLEHVRTFFILCVRDEYPFP